MPFSLKSPILQQSQLPAACSRGKRQGGTPLVASVPLQNHSSDLLYIRDEKNRREWLVDGGAFASIIPPSLAQRAKGPNQQCLTAANGTPIPCYGNATITVFIGKKAFRHTFIVADVKTSILGADFLAAHYLAPNHKDQTIIDLNDLSTIAENIQNRSYWSNKDGSLMAMPARRGPW